MEKIILTDCDGVVVDWNKSFSEWMAPKGYKLADDYEKHYTLAHRLNVYRQSIDYLVHEFNDRDIIANLEPIADAVKYVRLLAEEGFKFIAITSISKDPVILANRQKNLDSLFGKGTFIELNGLPIGASKYPVLQRWENSGYFWVEDKFSHALDGIGLNLTSIVVEHPYNEDFHAPRITKVSHTSPWKEIYKLAQLHYR